MHLEKNRSSLHEEIVCAPRLGRITFWSCPWLHVHERLLASNIEVTVVPFIALFLSAVDFYIASVIKVFREL